MPQPNSVITLVTGPTGFTGSHLVRSLVREGHRVRVLVRSAERARAVLSPGIEVVMGEIVDPAAVTRAVRGAQVIYHLAAAYREARYTDQYYWDVNVGSTSLLLDVARRDVALCHPPPSQASRVHSRHHPMTTPGR
jgi:dihydroflavonol-4-reductase